MKKWLLSITSVAFILTCGFANPGDKSNKKAASNVKIVNHKFKETKSFRAKNSTRISEKISKKPVKVKIVKKERMSSPEVKNLKRIVDKYDSDVISKEARNNLNSPHFKNQKHFR